MLKFLAEGKMKKTRMKVAREIRENQDNTVKLRTQGRMESERGKSHPVIEHGLR